MIGFVKFFNQERNYGFIVYASVPDSDRLDKEIIFNGNNAVPILDCEQHRGLKISFDFEEWDGREVATNVRPAECKRFTGRVMDFDRARHFGYVQSDDGATFFAHVKDVEPDRIGRRCIPEGTPVSFEISPDRVRALCIRNEDPALAEINPSIYVEQGQVHDWNGDVGHVVRPSGDHLAFLAKGIVIEGTETIQPGTWLQYGIVYHILFDKRDLQFRHRVYAANIFVCFPSSEPSLESTVEPGSIEEYFLRAPELPIAPVKIAEPTVYTPEERKLSLRELIRRKSAA